MAGSVNDSPLIKEHTMTMPHLMNCGHSDTGWCLDCVKELHDDKEEYESALQRAADKLTAFLTIGKVKQIGLLEVSYAIDELHDELHGENSTLEKKCDRLTDTISIAHDWLDGKWQHADDDPSGLSKDEIIAQLNAAFIVGVTPIT